MANNDAHKVKKDRFASAKQMKQVYDMTKQHDPSLPFVLGGVVLASALVFALIGWLWQSSVLYAVYFGVLGLLIGASIAAYILAKRAEKAAFSMIEGQQGQAGAALQGLRRGHWAYTQEPVAMDAGGSRRIEDAAMVFRAVGLPGVILIAEGPASRAKKLLIQESKKVNRLTPNVPVHTYRLGEGDDPNLITARDVAPTLAKLPKHLTKEEVTAVNKRLQALASFNPRQTGIPAGIDPNRIKSSRGPRR